MMQNLTSVRPGKWRLILRKSMLPNHDGEQRRYSFGLPVQIAPTRAVLFINTEVVSGGALDFAGGTDAITFDRLDAIRPELAFSVVRNEKAVNPLDGKPCRLLKFPQAAGFVPFGTITPDGNRHPHAGSGFGLFYVQSMPLELTAEKGFSGAWAKAENIWRRWELLQYKFDGNSFTVTQREMLAPDEVLPGFTLINRGLSAAVLDGHDLLLPVQGDFGPVDETGMCGFAPVPSGVMRWRRGSGGWHPVSYVKATGDITANEPSMIRMPDGVLLYTARQTGRQIPEKFDIFIWRSADNGNSWEKILHWPKVRAESPVSLHQTPDGTPFIAGNILTGSLGGSGFGYAREILAFWELGADFTALKAPCFAGCARTEFGMPPTAQGWRIDHPVSALVKLADGWHTMLTVRVMAVSETNSTMGPTEFSGCHVMEVIADNTRTQSQ